MEKQCQKLLTKLNAAGIRTLAALQARLHAFGVSKARSQKLRADPEGIVAVVKAGKLRVACLDTKDVTQLLNEWGLTEEAAGLCRDYIQTKKSTDTGGVDDVEERRLQ